MYPIFNRFSIAMQIGTIQTLASNNKLQTQMLAKDWKVWESKYNLQKYTTSVQLWTCDINTPMAACVPVPGWPEFIALLPMLSLARPCKHCANIAEHQHMAWACPSMDTLIILLNNCSWTFFKYLCNLDFIRTSF